MNSNYIINLNLIKTIFFIIIIPVIGQLILINILSYTRISALYYIIFLLFAFMYFPYFYWMNSAANFLVEHANKHFKLKIKSFKISLIINIIVLFNFVFFAAYVFSFVFNGGKPNLNIISCMFIFQFFGVFSYFYNSYFLCKLIATIELKRSVNFSDIAGNLALLSFPPLALYIIKSKIIRIQKKISR
jgi:lysylphosphatidylglycerol synthetase-like protein (DUF2156 family)